MSRPYVRLDKDNAAVLLVDHQAGLLALVRDIDPDKFSHVPCGHLTFDGQEEENLPTCLG